jgi:hypothetical protein
MEEAVRSKIKLIIQIGYSVICKIVTQCQNIGFGSRYTTLESQPICLPLLLTFSWLRTVFPKKKKSLTAYPVKWYRLLPTTFLFPFILCFRPVDGSTRTSEKSVHFNETTRRYNPEGCNIHSRRGENLKSHYVSLISEFKVE